MGPDRGLQLRNHDRKRPRPPRPAGRARPGRDGGVHRASPAGRIAGVDEAAPRRGRRDRLRWRGLWDPEAGPGSGVCIARRRATDRCLQGSGQGRRNRVQVPAVASTRPARRRRRRRVRRGAGCAADQLEGSLVRPERRAVGLGRGDGRAHGDVGRPGDRRRQESPRRNGGIAADDIDDPFRVHPGFRLAPVPGAVRSGDASRR